MNKRWWMPLALCAGLLASCGGDDGGGGFRPPPPDATIDVKAGTWLVTGNAIACGLSFEDSQQQIACNGVDINDYLPAGITADCDVDISGSTIRVNCSGTLNISGCVYDVTVSATGGTNEDRSFFSLAGTLQLTLAQGDRTECEFDSGCSGSFTVSGTWQETAPCTESGVVALSNRELGGFVLGAMFAELN